MGNTQHWVEKYAMMKIPKQVEGLLAVESISCGETHSTFVDEQRRAWRTNYLHVEPVARIAPNISCKLAAAGCYFTVFLDTQGSAWTTGHNDLGQLGHGFSAKKPLSEMKLKNMDNIVFGVCGKSHTILVDSDGWITSFGDNKFGQLGTKCKKSLNPKPTKISTLKTNPNHLFSINVTNTKSARAN